MKKKKAIFLNQPIVENTLLYHQKDTTKEYVRVEGRTENQGRFIKSIIRNPVTLACGAPGTGKTHCAIGTAIHLLKTERVDKIIISRPAVPVFEDIGFQPGTKDEKMLHFIRPMLDALEFFLPKGEPERLIRDKTIEVIPLGFLQGHNIRDGEIMIVDEIGLLKYEQFELILTRICPEGKLILMGDPRQSGGRESPLNEVISRLDHIDDIGVVYFSEIDNQRHPLVAKIGKALDRTTNSKTSNIPDDDWRIYNDEYDAEFDDEEDDIPF